MKTEGTKNILIIGNDPTIRELLIAAQPSVPMDIVEVPGNSECLDQFRRRHFDLIVTDTRTPGTEDIEFLKRVREMRPAAKVLVMVPASQPENVIAAIRAHAFGFFSKPIDPDAFMGLVQQALCIQDWNDGIEVLSARPEWITLRARCRMLTADRVIQFMRELKMDLDEENRENIGTAFREMLLNAIEHGAGFDADKTVEIGYIRTGRFIIYRILDSGDGFSFDALPHAAISNPSDDAATHIVLRNQQGLRPGGFGIMMTQGFVDELFHNEKGNEVMLIKYLH